MTRPSRSAAGRRLAWVRWCMTAFFALTTAACLVGLATFAARQDQVDRERVDRELLVHADRIALGIDIDADGLVFSSAPPGANLDTAVGLNAIGTAPTGIVIDGALQYAEPAARELPSARTVERLDAAVRHGAGSASTTTSDRSGTLTRWVAVPVPQARDATVLVGTAPSSSVDHQTVVLGLVAAVLGLVSVATLAGHLLSGIAMRPAVRQTEQQEQFLREAAHELRTPIATMALIAESGLRDPDTATGALRALDRRLAGMSMLVTSLLARARADQSGAAVSMRRLRLDQLVEVTVADLEAGDDVQVDARETVVRGNPELIAQAVRNLVENALGHAPGSRVEVTVGERAFVVADDGGAPGRRAVDGRAPRPAGTGTGLSIVEWVAEVHGGTVELGPSSSGGTRATMRFPEPATGTDDA
ncbi:hypothetical protein ASG04_12260 [Curtobacterium sp. Leaf183]|uniref:sensor histidine kinase n=1 Tax=Curtobacterium sp. Leaf183 TaxID=1736291 RepID=UPI0006F68E9F|nr:HAMP domain-containing sensor histidine kinase [Curtobacterium sp. Leaf183]KQS07931.1 hypothetical protein ASG04_12260 [Curtobacterium sp. Leaf183]